jgi:hypothetical protein
MPWKRKSALNSSFIGTRLDLITESTNSRTVSRFSVDHVYTTENSSMTSTASFHACRFFKYREAECTAKNQYRKIFPKKELRGYSPNFHILVSVCERFIYSHNRSAYSAAGNMSTDPTWQYIIYINCSQTQCGNWDWGRAIPRKGIYKWNFLCSVWINRVSSFCGMK